MVNAAIFVSGSGTNFEALMNQISAGNLDNTAIRLLISDRQDAYAFTRAKRLGVPAYFFNPKTYKNKEEYETEILKLLEQEQIDLIILAGYMRYIGSVLLKAYDRKIINIHPAYLPEFPGAHGIKDAYEAGVSQTGVTVHYVDEGIDTGEIIQQVRVPIDPNWSLEELESHVHAAEYDLFWQAVKQAAAQLEKKEGKEI